MTHSPSYPRSYRIIDVQQIIFFKLIQVLSHKKMIGTLQSTQLSIIIDHKIENVIILDPFVTPNPYLSLIVERRTLKSHLILLFI